MRIRCSRGGVVANDFEFEPGLSDRRITFGRSAECSVRLDMSPAISRTQATIIRRGGGWALMDGNEAGPSVTGCWVDGVRVIGEVLIFVGQQIKLFDSRGLTIELELGAIDDTLTQAERTEVPAAYRSTAAVVDRTAGGTATIREEIQEVQRAIALMRQSLKDHEGRCVAGENSALNQIRSMVEGQGEMIGSIGSRLDVIHQNDAAQDLKLRRVIGALTGLLCVVVIITSGRPDADDIFDRVLSVASGVGALGGGWSLIKKSDRTTADAP